MYVYKYLVIYFRVDFGCERNTTRILPLFGVDWLHLLRLRRSSTS